MLTRFSTFLFVLFLFAFKAKGSDSIVIHSVTQNENKKVENGLKQVLVPIGYLQQRSFTHQVDLSGRIKLGGGFLPFYFSGHSSPDYSVSYSQQISTYVNQSIQKIYILHQVFRI